MDISIVIPNFNGESILRENLPRVFESVENYSGGKWEIIVVDDSSTDNSLKILGKLKENLKNIKIIKNEKNLGFSSTVNKGVKEASGEVILLLNTDVIPQKGFLASLLNHFVDTSVFAVGCMDKSKEGEKVILRGRGVGKWKRGFLVHARGEVNKTDTLWASAGSAAFRKDIWEKLGGLDTVYNPFYWEDIDISYRSQKSGYKILFDPESVVIHEHEKGSIKSKYSSNKIKMISYRNQFIFVWKNITDLDLIISHILWLPYFFTNALLNRDWAFFVGFFRAFILLPKIIKSSIKAKKYFLKTDKEILESYR